MKKINSNEKIKMFIDESLEDGQEVKANKLMYFRFSSPFKPFPK